MILAAMILMVLGFVWSTLNTHQEEHSHEVDLSELVNDLSEEAQQYFEKFEKISFTSALSDEAYGLKKKRWYLVRFENGAEVYWNSNKVQFSSELVSARVQSKYVKYGDDFYLAFIKQNEMVLAIRLANDGVPSERLVQFAPQLKGHLIEYSTTNSHILSIVNDDDNEMPQVPFVLGMLLMTLLLFFVRLNQGKFWELLSYAVVLLLLDLFLNFLVLGNLNILATGNLGLEKLYLLVIHGFVLVPPAFVLKRYSESRSVSPWLGGVLIIVLLFLTDALANLIKTTVLESNIAFDFGSLYAVNWDTFLTLTVFGGMWFVILLYINVFKIFKDVSDTRIWILLMLSGVVFIGFQMIDANRPFSSLLIPLLFVVFSSLIIRWRLQKIPLFVLVVLSTSWLVWKSEIKKDDKYIKEYALSLLQSEDQRAELLLQSVEEQLAVEFLEPIDYSNFIERKDELEKRIKQLYFSNYLEKYELRVLSFDSLGNNINNSRSFNYDELNALFNFQTRSTASNYFYQITATEFVNSYIAKYENCDLEGHFGTTFILLQPRLIQSDYLYPEAFANQAEQTYYNTDILAYGIYYNRQLISQKGSYNYSLHNIPEIRPEGRVFHTGGFYHFYYLEKGGFEIILSKEYNSLFNLMSTVTFVSLFLLPIALILILLTLAYSRELVLRDLFVNKYLSGRIQLSLILILFVSLIVSLYIIVNYMSSNYRNQLESQVISTAKNISTQFQNTVGLEEKLQSEEKRLQILNEQSGAFKVDLNLYDQNGKLLSTTKPYLLNAQVLGDLMNPQAFSQMSGEKYSQLLIQEELEGTEYLSAYVPLFNGRNEVVAYLNLPYFARNQELRDQVLQLMVNIVNIYFFLLVIGLIVAWFVATRVSKPLVMLRERFAETSLGQDNALIVYNRNDEIGQLVKQYNQMVKALDESARILAQREKEGAWREMAKQVAHEIKNPLTPMKLSIQHLQRAFAEGSDRVEELFKKTSTLLIEQIESLSKMASEFSSFAKMPEEFFTETSVSDLLKSTIELFSQDEMLNITADIQENVSVWADPDQLKRVFQNILKNAKQAAHDGQEAKINVQLRTEDKMVVIQISDQGKGVPEEIRSKIFEPNFSTKTSGMGLGLAICKKIIETAKGEITFESRIGKGTTFTIRLPLL